LIIALFLAVPGRATCAGNAELSAISLYPRFRSTAGAERPLSDLEITKVNYRSGSAAPVRDHRMQTFGLEIVAIVGRRARTTAVAITDFRGGVCERQVPKWTGRSLVKPPPAPMGRQCQLATLGCSRSASKLSRWSIGMRERPLRPSTTLSPARAKGKFQGRPVVRWENRRRLLWLGSASTADRTADARLASQVGQHRKTANDRFGEWLRVLGHRQTKGAATDIPNLMPPRHTSTPPSAVACHRQLPGISLGPCSRRRRPGVVTRRLAPGVGAHRWP
jgi:hypothetical protein